MKVDAVILAKSTMWGRFCVAGIDIPSGMWLRFTGYDDGEPIAIGEAVRQTKNELITAGAITGYDSQGNPTRSTDSSVNRMQYSLLGDPAVRLAMPTRSLEVTSINDQPVTEGTTQTLKAGDL